MEGSLLQHLGVLCRRQGRHAQAIEQYQQAIRLFQQADDRAGEMQTCDLAGTAERQQNHLDAAAAWYERSRELARELGDKRQLAITAQNLGILHQTRAAPLADDHPQRRALLQQAVVSVEESLALRLEMQNPLDAAASHAQLGILHRRLGDLDAAEPQARRALEIFEPLNHPHLMQVYDSLMEIAHARGDTEAAAQWRAKRDAKLAEVAKLRRGEDQEQSSVNSDPLSNEGVEWVLAVARAVYQARQHSQPLPPDVAEILAQLQEAPRLFPPSPRFSKPSRAATRPPPPTISPRDWRKFAPRWWPGLARRMG